MHNGHGGELGRSDFCQNAPMFSVLRCSEDMVPCAVHLVLCTLISPKFNKMYEIWRLQPYFEVWFVPLNSLFHACTAQAMRHYLQITGRDHPPGCTKPGD